MATFAISNAPNGANLETFLGTLNKYGSGLAQACRFMVTITKPPVMFSESNFAANISKDLSFLCEQAELPGKSLSVQDARYYGPNFKYPIQTMYNDITMSFLVRDEMYEKQFFDDWMMTINPTNTYDFYYKSHYATTISIFQYSPVQDSEDSKSHATYALNLQKAFPIAVAPMGLVWSEENFHRISVTFAYTEFTRIDDPKRYGYTLVSTGAGTGPVTMQSGSILGGSNTSFSSVTRTIDGKVS